MFPHPHIGNPLDPGKLRGRFYAAMVAAGMGDRCGAEGGITFHSLRHSFGTRMAGAGVPMRTLQEWMGHAHYATTAIYADYQPDQGREAGDGRAGVHPPGVQFGVQSERN